MAWRVADDEAVLLHADTSAYFGLNRTATLLWERIAEHPVTADQLTEWGRSVFADAPPDLAGQVSIFIEQLVELGLVSSEESTEAPAPPPGVAKESEAQPWETRAVERFGELEKLILSGE